MTTEACISVPNSSIQIGANIAEFEKVFEDMDVKTSEIDAAMENVY